jgi:hypothetical protein
MLERSSYLSPLYFLHRCILSDAALVNTDEPGGRLRFCFAGRWRQETRPRAVSLQCLQLEGCSISFKVSPHIEWFDRITLKCEISQNVT